MTRNIKTSILRLSCLAAFALAAVLATSAAQAQSSMWQTAPNGEQRAADTAAERGDAAVSDISTVKVPVAPTLFTEAHILLSGHGDPSIQLRF